MDAREAEGDRLDKQAVNEFVEERFAAALDLFTQAAKQYITCAEENPANTRARTKAEKALNLVGKLKAEIKSGGLVPVTDATQAGSAPGSGPRRGRSPATNRGTRTSQGTGDASGYSPKEVDALIATSKINGETYLPWMDDDRGEDFTNGMYTDPSGHLKLASGQRSGFKRWMRASQLTENCTMIKEVTSHSIKQTVVGDCSFVCSLCVAADYEHFFKIPLIVRVIHR